MPHAPKAFCLEPRCRVRVARGRCAQHARKAERRRGTYVERGYGGQWKRIRKRHLAEFPNCVRCMAEDSRFVDDPVMVDHIIPLEEGGTHAEDNLQTLCRGGGGTPNHHAIKTAEDRDRYGWAA